MFLVAVSARLEATGPAIGVMKSGGSAAAAPAAATLISITTQKRPCLVWRRRAMQPPGLGRGEDQSPTGWRRDGFPEMLGPRVQGVRRQVFMLPW